MPIAAAALIDIIVTVVFAAIGRRNHGESSAVVGIAQTAWPFVLGALVGWVILVLTKRAHAGTTLSSGVIVWLATVIVGMLVRQASGQGTALPFIIVALIFNAVCMLGWRGVDALVTKRRAV